MRRYLVLFALAWPVAACQAAPPPQPPKPVRLYVFDCGTLHVSDPARFRLKKEDLAVTDLSVACFLVAHPKGTLMWDPGAVPDNAWKPTGAAVKHHIVLPDSQTRDVTMIKPLKPQLAAGGHAPSDITISPCRIIITITPPTRTSLRAPHGSRTMTTTYWVMEAS